MLSLKAQGPNLGPRIVIVIRDIKVSFVVRCSYLNSDSQQQQQEIIRDVEIGGEHGRLGELAGLYVIVSSFAYCLPKSLGYKHERGEGVPRPGRRGRSVNGRR